MNKKADKLEGLIYDGNVWDIAPQQSKNNSQQQNDNKMHETLKKIDPKKRVFKRLGYTALETVELIDNMNKLIANLSIHYQKLRNFHWNVKGADFFDLHERFEQQYNWTKIVIDDLAERIRVFGQTPLSTMHEYIKQSEIKECGTDLSGKEMVGEIIKDQEILLKYMSDVIEKSIEHGDSGTEDLVKGYVKQIEKNHWMLTAFSSQN